jgi:4-amino-4-deoxy-L-arabinose transferase-like glycosyltransferase
MSASPPEFVTPNTTETRGGPSPKSITAGSPGRLVQVALAFTIAVAVLGQGIRAPFIKDAEPQSAQWIVDIVNNGHWLLPQDYYHLVNRKPPLFYWLSAIATKATGGQVDETSARVVSLVAGAALAAEVMAWSAMRLGVCGGWLTFAFLLGTYGYAARATVALTDMLLTFLLFSTYIVLMPRLTRLARARSATLSPLDDRRELKVTVGEDHSPRWFDSRWYTVGAGVLLGLAILTKGPLAVLLLALAFFIYCLLLRTNPLRLPIRMWPWDVLVVSLAVAAIWYLPAFEVGRAANLGGVFLQENLGHFLPASVGGTGEAARPFYYIALRAIGASLPLSLLIPAAALSCADYAPSARQDLLYQLSMALAVLLFFSLASAKRDDYILPALPPLAILYGSLFVLTDSANDTRAHLAERLRDIAVAGTSAALLLGIIGIFIFLRSGWHLRIASGLASSDQSSVAILTRGIAQLNGPFVDFGVLMIAGASIALAGVFYGRPLISGAGFGLLCLAGSTLWIGTVKPIEASTRSVATFSLKVRAQVGNASIYVAHPDPEMAWYYGQELPVIPHAVAATGGSSYRTYFVGRPGDLTAIAPAVRQHMRLIIQSHVLGGGGPPALYLFEIPG